MKQDSAHHDRKRSKARTSLLRAGWCLPGSDDDRSSSVDPCHTRSCMWLGTCKAPQWTCGPGPPHSSISPTNPPPTLSSKTGPHPAFPVNEEKEAVWGPPANHLKSKMSPYTFIPDTFKSSTTYKSTRKKYTQPPWCLKGHCKHFTT